MPYYIHKKNESVQYDIWESSRADAFMKCKEKGPDYTVTFVATDDEIANWRLREADRLLSGKYLRVPWHNHQAHQPDHYAHLSLDVPGMVAYTADVEHGIQDRQIRTKPGRYLTQFYGQYFSTAEIADYVAACAAVQTDLKLATSEANIIAIYMHGPASCMDARHFHEMNIDTHPAIVYSYPSTLAVAYYGDLESNTISQRCIVWPERKHYTRIYGTGPLQELLHKAGYSRGSIAGATIRRIPHDNGCDLYMPYVDSYESEPGDPDSKYAKDDGGRVLTLTARGSIDCGTCSGYVTIEDENDDSEDENDDSDMTQCEHCGRNFEDNDERSTPVGDEYWCESCTIDATSTYQDTDCTNTWIEVDEFTSAETEVRNSHDLVDLCRTCADRYLWCDHCETAYDSADSFECPTCERALRCDKTPNMFEPIVVEETEEVRSEV